MLFKDGIVCFSSFLSNTKQQIDQKNHMIHKMEKQALFVMNKGKRLEASW